MRTAEELRRLDALAASRVLGISRDEWWESPEYGWNYLNEGRTLSSELRHYTTDATACQELKDKARADGWTFMVTAYSPSANRHGEPIFMAMLMRADRDEIAKSNCDDSEFVAVVLACLRAYGAKV